MKIVGGRPLVLGTAIAIATVGMAIGAAPPSQAARPSCSSSTALAQRPLVRYGDTGSCVRDLQRRLVAHGERIAVDGIFGPHTLAAVRAYQRTHHLVVDGVVGRHTWGSLLAQERTTQPAASCPSHPVTYYGQSGACVAAVQQLLIRHGYSVGSSGVDGSFGPATLAAVRAYQRTHHLVVDGIVGRHTWGSLLAGTRTTQPAASCPSHPVTYYGQSGACVAAVQRLLIRHGYSVGSSGVDGSFGPATLAAVKSFQRSRNLDATGVVDELSWKALLSFGPRGSACVDARYAHLTTAERVGQLIMVGMERGDQGQVDRLIARQHVGNIVYLGGWSGDGTVGRTSDGLQRRATWSATVGTGILIAADQEGGYVQQLTGTGFTRLPTALTQGTWSPAHQRSVAATVGQQLRDVGVNVDLAPVTDTVPKSLGTRNGPIGHYYREYGYTPAVVSTAVTNVVHGLNSTGEISTLKHFPGIGRITNNTDTSSTGITDSTMTATDPYLTPFKAGVNAGTGMVMIGLAWYPKIDAANQAAFSHRIITGILRGNLGFHGVVISDSLSAVAVNHISPGQRAVRFIEAGGDIALTGAPSQVPAMVSAILARMKTSPAFAAQVSASVHRVLTLKSEHGLLNCA